jgi:SAM-dependent methyltransferase
MDPALGRYKSEEFIRIVGERGGPLSGRRFLKTDLREEAWGEDEVLRSLSSSGASFFGIDIAGATVRRARQRQGAQGPAAHLCVGDVRRLPFEDGAFGVILSPSTLDHFWDESDLLLSLGELRRVLVSGGILILALNNRHNANFFLMGRLEGLLRRRRYPMRFFTREAAGEILQRAGFEVGRCEAIVHIPSPANAFLCFLRRVRGARIADILGRWLVRVARWAGAREKMRRHTGWFLVFSCCKKEQR